MHPLTESTVIIQTTSHALPATPSWCGEVVVMAQFLRRRAMLAKMSARGRVARRRVGRSEVIDVLAVRFGDAVRGARTRDAFSERVHPLAPAFMPRVGRDHVPARSTRSRCVAALPWEAGDALRTLCLDDLRGRQPDGEQHPCGRTDRAGNRWKVFDSDGIREAARHRAFPQTPEQPAPHRRLEELCAPGSTGRTRGAIVRPRTTVVHAHSSQWLGTLGHPGHGEDRQEVRRTGGVIPSSLRAHPLPEERALLRRDGLSGTGAVQADLRGLAVVMRGTHARLRGADTRARACRSAVLPPGTCAGPHTLRRP